MDGGLCECGCGDPAPIAARTNKKLGWVTGKPLRFINGHSRRRGPVDYIEEDRGYETPCWIWQRTLNNKGYGICRRDGRWFAAHRWFYEQRLGPIPSGVELDHLCRVPACVNPDHLEPVSHAINIQRGKNAKLNAALVKQIRLSPRSALELAEIYGVHSSTIDNIRARKTWSNIP